MSDIAAIVDGEAQLRAAMLAGDVAALDALLLDDMVFINQDGVRLTKDADLSAHRSRTLVLDQVQPMADPTVRSLGDVAVVIADFALAGRYAGQAFAGAFVYTRVWRRGVDGWRIAAGHCSARAASTAQRVSCGP